MAVKFVCKLGPRSPLKLILRLQHKQNPKRNESSDVSDYLKNTPEYQQMKENLPKSLLRKYKTPESMYIVNTNTAKEIVNTIKCYLSTDSPIIEVNPGFGFLSKELLNSQQSNLYMYETSNQFLPYLNDIQTKNPDRVTYKIADFFGMWKLAFQDKIDHGNRIKDLLGVLATDNNDRIVKIIGSMPGLSFVKHLIYNIVFHNKTNQLGQPDLFITMPGYHYEFLTDSGIQFGKHKSVPVMFQLLFDYKVLTKVPRVHFLPWTYPVNNKRFTMMDEYSLYLVNITQKKKLPCLPDYLPLLWYFFKPHVLSKSTRVIPMLEQWIPGCGVWLITGQDPPDTNKELAPSKDDAELPHMTIFTEFGDLTLQQKITIFKRFISWPEFEHCQFRTTMENNLPKSISAVDDDDKDSIIVPHIDDLEHTDEHDT